VAELATALSQLMLNAYLRKLRMSLLGASEIRELAAALDIKAI
jgi:hypothetical protein